MPSVGASVTLSSTVMCGNRLNAWKTMPTSRRSRFSLMSSWITFRPSTVMVPPCVGSNPLMQRSSVDFPEPDAPMRHTTWCSSTVEVDLVEHGVEPEPLDDPADLDERHQPPPAWVRCWSRFTR